MTGDLTPEVFADDCRQCLTVALYVLQASFDMLCLHFGFSARHVAVRSAHMRHVAIS